MPIAAMKPPLRVSAPRQRGLALTAVLVALHFAGRGLPAQELEPLPLAEPNWQEPLDEWQSPLAAKPLDDIPQSLPAGSLSFAWLAPGGATGFGSTDFDAHYTWQVGQAFDREPLLVTPGVGFHLWSGPDVLDLPPQ